MIQVMSDPFNVFWKLWYYLWLLIKKIFIILLLNKQYRVYLNVEEEKIMQLMEEIYQFELQVSLNIGKILLIVINEEETEFQQRYCFFFNKIGSAYFY